MRRNDKSGTNPRKTRAREPEFANARADGLVACQGFGTT